MRTVDVYAWRSDLGNGSGDGDRIALQRLTRAVTPAVGGVIISSR